MADRDEALHYLLSKLKNEDGWSSSNLAWNEDKLSIIADQFSSFDGVAKVKVLLSFIGMTPRTINQVTPLYTEVSSFQGVGIEEFHCILKCPHFRVLE